jgi:hypothetical protein
MNQHLSNLEQLKFRIGLSGTYWDKKPQYSIWVNDKKYAGGTTILPSDHIFYIEFQFDCAEESENFLKIRLENKEDSDTIENSEKTEILKDMLLNVHSIEIDDIAIDQLMWSESQFYPDNPDRPIIDQCVNLGWNGSYILKFTSPFYLWLLESS